MKNTFFFIAIIALTGLFTSCQKDQLENEMAAPVSKMQPQKLIENVENAMLDFAVAIETSKNAQRTLEHQIFFFPYNLSKSL